MVRDLKHWAWAGACATIGSSQSLIAMVVMLGLWAGIAEIVSAANALHYHDEIAAITLTCVNAPFAGLLFANFLRLRYDLRELHTPQRRQLLAGSLTFFLVITVVAPCALALSWRLTLLDVLLVMLGPLTGAVGAALWTLHSRTRVAEPEVSPDRAIPARLFRRIPSHDRAIRLALGPPYAPASWRWRLAQFALVFMVLFAPSLLVIAFGRSLNSRDFAAMMHACEFLSFGAAIALCWLWPLSRALALFNPERGASTELALLPGLGGRQSLWRICRLAVGLPALALAVLLLMALG
ncbi:MAG TPA: hypothetical protein VHX12_06935, partial [Acidisoma sp.]|nr:hypothetical protein [Acidisoma sp.]